MLFCIQMFKQSYWKLIVIWHACLNLVVSAEWYFSTPTAFYPDADGCAVATPNWLINNQSRTQSPRSSSSRNEGLWHNPSHNRIWLVLEVGRNVAIYQMLVTFAQDSDNFIGLREYWQLFWFIFPQKFNCKNVLYNNSLFIAIRTRISLNSMTTEWMLFIYRTNRKM